MEEATFLQELCSPGFRIFCYYYHHSSCSVGLAYACHHHMVVAIPPCYPLRSRGRLVSCSFITHEHMAFKAMNKCLETPLASLRPLVEMYAFVCASGHRGWIVNLALDPAGHRGWTVDLALDAAEHRGWTVDRALDLVLDVGPITRGQAHQANVFLWGTARMEFPVATPTWNLEMGQYIVFCTKYA